MSSRVYECNISKEQELKKLLEYDPYLDSKLTEDDLKKLREDESANVIFARQDYVLKEGAALDLDREKCYLFLKATDEFLDKAEKKLKASIEGIKRVDPEMESKIITSIENERSKAEQGFGFIFGG
ncbi:MAG: hypothetical protein ACP5RF_02555 [Candidatus Micrarchaeia archaeon]